MIKDFLKNESGQGLVEYGLAIALVGIAAIVALAAMGNSTADIIEGASDAVDKSVTSPESLDAGLNFTNETKIIVDSASDLVESGQSYY